MKKQTTIFGAALILLSSLLIAAAANDPVADSLNALRQKKKLKVLVTDSGLGGLSVCADLEKKALARKTFESIEIVFCNSLPEPGYGYNNLPTTAQKARVFSEAMRGMVRTCDPDVVLIACNTLSVVYPDTEISRTLKTPVVGIVDIGVAMLCEKLEQDPSSAAVIFGTETTIAANSHKSGCLAKGIAEARLVTEPCSELAGEIQSAPHGDAARNLIDLYVGEAAEKLAAHPGKIYATMCCTHYGYCAEEFLKAFAIAGKKNVEVVNPNEKMADLLFPAAAREVSSNPQVTVQVLSRAFLSPEETKGIAALMEKDSPKTASALKNYQHKKDLFNFAR